jgi:hypothetical protein
MHASKTIDKYGEIVIRRPKKSDGLEILGNDIIFPTINMTNNTSPEFFQWLIYVQVRHHESSVRVFNCIYGKAQA